MFPTELTHYVLVITFTFNHTGYFFSLADVVVFHNLLQIYLQYYIQSHDSFTCVMCQATPTDSSFLRKYMSFSLLINSLKCDIKQTVRCELKHLVNTVMNICVTQKVGNFLTRCGTLSFFRILLQRVCCCVLNSYITFFI